MKLHRSGGAVASAVAASLLLSGCPGESTWTPEQNLKPAFVGTITKSTYDGVNDDLLTAGLGKTGLASATPPAVANATSPSAAELRRLAIYVNYRALVDMSANGGFGTLYGPNVDVNGNPTSSEGKIAGTEYLAYADDGSGKQNVTMMVQIPASFDASKACIVTATSSGSRGVYGAIGTAGEWGLKHGCAVAYTDKGTGTGFHELATDTVNVQNGTRRTAAAAGKESNFTASLTGTELAAFNAAWPNRVATKHAHSQQNPERNWGRNALDAIQFAFYVINEERAARNTDGTAKVDYKPGNTVVIASSVSNGGGSAIAAAEQDTEGLIDGVAVGEPTLELTPPAGLTVVRGVTPQAVARPLFDYYSLGNLLMGCASQSSRAANAWGIAAVRPVPAFASNMCAGLKAKGYLTKGTLQEQADEALDNLLAAGYQQESIPLFATHFTSTYFGILPTFGNAYGRFSVKDNLCGISMAPADTSGKPTVYAPATLAQAFSNSSGVVPTAGLALINNNSVGGPVNYTIAVSPSTGVQDYSLDVGVCFRSLWTGNDANALAVQSGVRETLRTGNLRGKPAIIVNGRADTQIPVNFNARPYYGLNKQVEGAQSKLTYIEVTNAQHFDAFIDSALFPGYDSAYIPLHLYFIRAMDAMYAHLTQGAPLPGSQVVRTTPRGGTPGAAPPITSANVPPIPVTPAAANQITFSNNTVTVPD
ncbi:MAG: D-(-)-3-hydroxybutyrate oligomer hydrolase [Burkholderiales bacterium]